MSLRPIDPIDACVRETASLFQAWQTEQGAESAISLIRLEHAAREWIAALGQFAEFTCRPCVRLTLRRESGGFSCTIMDNSEGLPCAQLVRNRDEGRAAIYMIRLMADRVGYRKGRRTNTATLSVMPRIRLAEDLPVMSRATAAERPTDAAPALLADHLQNCLEARRKHAA